MISDMMMILVAESLMIMMLSLVIVSATIIITVFKVIKDCNKCKYDIHIISASCLRLQFLYLILFLSFFIRYSPCSSPLITSHLCVSHNYKLKPRKRNQEEIGPGNPRAISVNRESLRAGGERWLGCSRKTGGYSVHTHSPPL